MKVNKQKSVINLPDLLFIKYCEETFGLNRGVYNVIDEWFYKKDVKDIKMRREKILEFLLFAKSTLNSLNGKLKFGKGNLVNLLSEYVNTSESNHSRNLKRNNHICQ